METEITIKRNFYISSMVQTEVMKDRLQKIAYELPQPLRASPKAMKDHF